MSVNLPDRRARRLTDFSRVESTHEAWPVRSRMSGDGRAYSSCPQNQMEIRPFREADRASVVALWIEVFPDPAPHNELGGAIDHKISVDGGLFFVAVDSDCVLLGTVMGGYDGHRGWVYSLAVAPDRRRVRIGAALMHRIEEELANLGCPKINLQVRGDNEKMSSRSIANLVTRLKIASAWASSRRKGQEGHNTARRLRRRC